MVSIIDGHRSNILIFDVIIIILVDSEMYATSIFTEELTNYRWYPCVAT